MALSYDPEKRQLTLERRGLDFEDAKEAFAGQHFDRIDDRQDYGETRWISVGAIKTVIVVIVWTWRNNIRRIISMRKADKDERAAYLAKLD